jgi:hypothetical protein
VIVERMSPLRRWTPPVGWVRVPSGPGTRLVHLRALHFPAARDLALLVRDLGTFDVDGTVTVTGGACRQEVTTDAWVLSLPALPAELRILTLTGRAIATGAWRVRVSADPTVPSQVEVEQAASPFGASLAGAVAAGTRRSTLADLGRRRPLLPPAEDASLAG